MNKLIALLILFVFVASGCSKNNDEVDPNLTVDFLKQTAWSGKLTREGTDGAPNYNPIVVHDRISLVFTTENTGEWELQDYRDTAGNNIQSGGFQYSVDGKCFHFDPYNASYLRGDYLVQEKSSKKLKMGRDIQSVHDYQIMDLRRTY